MPHRSRAFLALLAVGGLTAAAPAFATEGPPGGGQPLPDTLQPVGIPPTGQPPTRRVKRPRVLAVRVTPRRVVRGHRARLQVALAGSGRVRVTIARSVRSRRHTVSSRTVSAPSSARVLRSPAGLRPGRYRVTVVAFDAEGRRSRAVHRTLLVVRR
jgi:hypothetical protein